jgi:adenylate kinase
MASYAWAKDEASDSSRTPRAGSSSPVARVIGGSVPGNGPSPAARPGTEDAVACRADEASGGQYRRRVIVLSPPGAGKGTHCARLASATGIAHISSGELLRTVMNQRTVLGEQVREFTARGDLVPDDLIIRMVLPIVVAANRDTGGYLLDGFPRTVPQAVRAAEIGVALDLSGDAVVYLTAPTDVLVERLRARAEREGRNDDTPVVIKHRLAVFEVETRPVVEYYRSRGLLLEIDAARPEDEVQADLCNRLAVEAR